MMHNLHKLGKVKAYQLFIYIEDNEDFITGINEPRYVDDLTLEMQYLIYTELNRSISRMIHDLRK